MVKKRIGILTGGGDVQPLNSVIASAIEAAKGKKIELIGFKNGWEGILKEKYIFLSKVKIDPLIGGTVLKSSRINLANIVEGGQQIIKKLNKLNQNIKIIV